MTVNIGTADRMFRIALGLILVALPFVSSLALFATGPATIVSVIAGLILIATAAVRFCPLYRIFGIRTCQR